MTNVYGYSWHQTTVAKVEAGKRPVKLSEAIAVSYVLGVPLTQLANPVGGDQPTTPAATQLALVELARLEQYVTQRKTELTSTEPTE
jgi:hypothetical protein